MTPLSLRKIEEAAKAATPGEWFPVHDVILTDIPGRAETDSVASCVGDDNATANATHIANMDPATVLALVAVVRAARAVGYSNGFDAAYPEKLAALREALRGIEE